VGNTPTNLQQRHHQRKHGQDQTIPETQARYWVVDRDAAQTVTLHRLGRTGEYEVATKMPLAWLLNTAPSDHLD
jgi:hypothetical protein